MTTEQPMSADAASKKHRRKRRDKDRPKRAMSGYLVFLSKHREVLSGEHPEWSVTEVTKELAKRWKDVSDEERNECQEISDKDKKRYYGEMQDYVPLPDEKEETIYAEPQFDKDGKRKRRKKDKNAPRKNRSAYIIWAAEYRTKHFRPHASSTNAISFKEQAKQLGTAWAEMSEAQKKKFETLAAEEAAEYCRKRAEYMETKKKISEDSREHLRERLLNEKRAWEATRIAAAELKDDRKGTKPVVLVKAAKVKKPSGSAPKKSKTSGDSSSMMEEIKDAIETVAQENAWYMVLGKYESDPKKVTEAYFNFINNANAKRGADPKAFLVAVLGYADVQLNLL
jgi:high mobility group protein B2